MNSYQIDTLVTLSTAFTAADGVTPVDPATVTLYVVKPDGSELEFTGGQLNHPATGQFNYAQLMDQSGVWIYKWQGSGGVDVTTADTYVSVVESVPIPG